jgi:hypothetical protein
MLKFAIYPTLLTIILVLACCKKQDNTLPALKQVSSPDAGDSLSLAIDSLPVYPVQYTCRGLYTYRTDCPYPVHESTSLMQGAIQFITADSIRLNNIFSYNWDSIVTFRLNSAREFKFHVRHRDAKFALVGDSVFYSLHIEHCSLGYGCDIWFDDYSFAGKVSR